MPDIFIRTKKSVHPSATKYLNHAHMFDSFCQNPDGLSFKTQEQDEEILLFLRRHFISNLSWITTSVILIIIPPLTLVVNSKFSIIPFLSNLSFQFIFFFLLLYYLAVFTFAFISFLTWYYNISLITNKKVVDVDFADLVYKNVATTSLNLIQDVSYKQVGVLASFFDYGDILVQTAGEIENFEFPKAPRPEQSVEIIGSLIGKGKSVS